MAFSCREAPGYNVTLEQQHLVQFAQEQRRRGEAAKLQAAKQRAAAARLAGLGKEVAAERLYADKKSTCNKVGCNTGVPVMSAFIPDFQAGYRVCTF